MGFVRLEKDTSPQIGSVRPIEVSKTYDLRYKSMYFRIYASCLKILYFLPPFGHPKVCWLKKIIHNFAFAIKFNAESEILLQKPYFE